MNLNASNITYVSFCIKLYWKLKNGATYNFVKCFPDMPEQYFLSKLMQHIPINVLKSKRKPVHENNCGFHCIPLKSEKIN